MLSWSGGAQQKMVVKGVIEGPKQVSGSCPVGELRKYNLMQSGFMQIGVDQNHGAAGGLKVQPDRSLPGGWF